MSSENSTKAQGQKGRVGRTSSSFTGFTMVTSAQTKRSATSYANIYDGPVPRVRELAQASHTAFVELHRAAKPQGPQLPTAVFIKNVLAMFLSVDKRAAILCYDVSQNFNSICHPVHVPTATEEFARYFPRVYHTRGSITVKCRVTSSKSLLDMKRELMEKLKKHSYYIRPTILKAIRTSKAGWFYMAHPDLTYRDDFQQQLPMLIEQRFGKNIEFQVSPESEIQELDGQRVSQRVLVARCPYEDVELIRSFFTEAFSPDSSLSIGYLARYVFVPSIPVGSCNKNHLVSFLRMQKQFHSNVFWYNLIGVRHFDQDSLLLPDSQSGEEAQRPPNPKTPKVQPPDTQETPVEELEILNGDADNQPMETDETETTNTTQEKAGHSQSEQKISLRRLLYELESRNGGFLIHAAYPSTDATRIFVLCSESNKQETLEKLQNLDDIVDQVFDQSAKALYFLPHEKPYVQNHPVLSNTQRSFVQSLVQLTGDPNPQDAPETFHQERNESYATKLISPSPAKRQRDGTKVAHQVTTAYKSNQEKDTKIQSDLNETIAKLQRIQNQEVRTKDSIATLNDRLDQQGADIEVLGASIQATNKKVDQVCDTQIAQGDTMQSMNNSLHAILKEVTALTDFNKQFSDMAESPQGGGVMKP